MGHVEAMLRPSRAKLSQVGAKLGQVGSKLGQVGAKLASVSILRGPRGALGGAQTFKIDF